jgi:hypothetical protein
MKKIMWKFMYFYEEEKSLIESLIRKMREGDDGILPKIAGILSGPIVSRDTCTALSSEDADEIMDFIRDYEAGEFIEEGGVQRLIHKGTG